VDAAATINADAAEDARLGILIKAEEAAAAVAWNAAGDAAALNSINCAANTTSGRPSAARSGRDAAAANRTGDSREMAAGGEGALAERRKREGEASGEGEIRAGTSRTGVGSCGRKT
jgi:hypothetical protein